MANTKLQKIVVQNFRALSNVEVELGSHLTVICGKNGTSKSSLLGIAAQVFSFEKDYEGDQELSYQTISGSAFKSLPAAHFRFSEKFDVPGSLQATIELFDGYTNDKATAELQLMKRTTAGKIRPRPVVRNNSTASESNTSRNFTHPVIYLGLERLQPIASRDYQVVDFGYLSQHKDKFLSLSNRLLNKTASCATATSGTLASAVAHTDKYDQDSVSTGEDNVGQIVLALMSFRKLKEEYSNYKGGLLLIDEADAGLFPAAQVALIDVLEQECNELGIQVVMTSHSPSMIERIYELSSKYRRKFKTIYLSDTFGPVRVIADASWVDIYADLHISTVPALSGAALPKINVYFEDREGYDLFLHLMQRQPSKKYIKCLDDVTLGCSNYIQLIQKGVQEFSQRSVIVLDSDVSGTEKLNSIVLLPGSLPPDQLIFEYLYNIPSDHEIWVNSIRFTKPVFVRAAQPVIGSLSLVGDVIKLKDFIEAFRKKESKDRAREIFKKFYKDPEFQKFIALKGKENPWRQWIIGHKDLAADFRGRFVSCVKSAMTVGYGVDATKTAIFSS